MAPPHATDLIDTVIYYFLEKRKKKRVKNVTSLSNVKKQVLQSLFSDIHLNNTSKKHPCNNSHFNEKKNYNG